jgi:uncharacterized protein YdaL
MKSNRRILLALALLLCSLGPHPLAGSNTPAPRPADVLIIHDSLPGPIPSGIVDGNNIIDLLGHFGMKGELVSFEDYRAGQIARHRFVIVLGVDDRTVACPRHLLTDIRGGHAGVLVQQALERAARRSSVRRMAGIPAETGGLDEWL